MKQGLERIIGVSALALLIVNVTVGAGIFGLPSVAAKDLGAAAVLAYLLCAVVMGLVGLCLAEAGSRVPSTGGLYAFATAAFGPFAGAFVGTLLLTANGVFTDAAVGALFGDTLGVIFPAFAAPVPRALAIVGLYGVVAWANVRGVRGGVTLTKLTTIAKLLPLVVLVVAGVFAVRAENLHWTVTPSVPAVGRTAVVLIFAFVGIEGALSTTGETRDPARTIPRAIALGLGGVTLLYLALQFVAQGVLGDALATTTEPPLAAAARIVFGAAGQQLVLWGTLLSTVGFIVSDALSQPRALLALAEDGFVPALFGRIDPVRRTPGPAIVAYVVVAAGLAISGTFTALALLGASGTLAIYLVCCLGVLRLRARGIAEGGPPFVVPGGPIVPLLAAAGIVAMLASLRLPELLALFGIAALGAIPYALRRTAP